MIWSIDAELDEVLADAKAAMTSCNDEDAAVNSKISAVLPKVRKAKQDAEHDKETIQVIVKKFIVRFMGLSINHLLNTLIIGTRDCQSRSLSGALRLCGVGRCRTNLRQGFVGQEGD